DLRDRHRDFRRSQKEIGQAAAKLTRRAVIVGGRVLNVREATSRKSEDKRSDDEVFHKMPLTTKQNLSGQSNISFSILSLGPVLRHNHRDGNGNGKDEHDDSERQQSRERKIMRHNHFDSNKGEHEREAGFQINEPIHQVREQEIERAQTKNGADVRRINNKRVLSDRKNGRDRIDRENEVHHVDDDEDKRERRQHPAVVDLGGEVLSVKFVGHVNGAPDEAHD